MEVYVHVVQLSCRTLYAKNGKTSGMVYRNCRLEVMRVWLNQIRVCGRGDEYIVAVAQGRGLRWALLGWSVRL